MHYRAGYVILLILAISNSVVSNWKFYAHYIRYRIGIESYAVFLEKGTIEGPVYQRNQALAEYIIAQTIPDDKIYHWTDFPQVYYLADRRAPIDMIWPTQAEITGSYKRIFAEQTRFIILGSSRYLPEPDWMQEELRKAYRLETVIAGQKVYRRVAP